MLPLARARLVLVVTMLAASVVSACDADPSETSGSPGGVETTAATDDPQCPRTSVSSVRAGATVTFGPTAGVPPTTASGEPLVVVGTVFAEDCEPLAGATLTMHQTDGSGEYGPGHGTDDMRCCYLGGSVVTDAEGHFQVITVRPAHYRGEANPPPAHIHLEVSHPDAAKLNSEIVFADDDLLPANAQGQGLIVTDPVRDGDSWRGVADIVMSDSGGA